MSFSFAAAGITFRTLEECKAQLKQKGFAGKVLLSDQDMAALLALVTADPRYKLTPADDLRYMEGLLELPKGFVREFGFVPAADSETCTCGREPNALDLVHTALQEGVHSRQLVRDAIIGLSNIFEMADGGRKGSCIACGRSFVLERYTRHRPYLYG